MSGRVYALGVGLALVALALVLTDQYLSGLPGVTGANVRRLREGMTLAEVEAILGGPGTEKVLGFAPLLSLRRPADAPPERPEFVLAVNIKTVVGDGEPARLTEAPHKIDFSGWTDLLMRTPQALRSWKGTRGEVEVLFDQDERVLEFRFWPRQDDPFARLRAWLGW
jgi:hypothetical protein